MYQSHLRISMTTFRLLSKLAKSSRRLALCALLPLASLAHGQVQVTTYHNDNLRTGLNSNETVLNLSNVRPSKFGLLFSLPVDGQVYAQPLYLPNVTIPGKGVHNVLYVATEHNSLYAFDADSNLGANSKPLWVRNFGLSVPNSETGSGDITPEIGITSTPVIYVRKTGVPVLYLISKTKNFDPQNNVVYLQKLYSVNVTNGSNAQNPIVINARVAGIGDGSVNGTVTFNPLIQHSRSALLLVPPVNGTGDSTLYVAFASHGDGGPYHGWIFAVDADQMKVLKVLNTTPNAKTDPSGYPLAAGGVWQGGAGPASDGSSVYFATGNGWFDPTTQAYGDSILRLDVASNTILDYFTPSDQLSLDDNDTDLGSGGVMLLPPSATGTSGKNLMVQSGKEGTLYLVDAANMGHFNATTDQVVQELKSTMGGIFGSPACFNHYVYFGPSYSSIVAFSLINGRFGKLSPVQYTSTYYNFPGPSPSISSNGLLNPIVWAIQTDGYNSGGTSILHAYSATNLGTELYNSNMIPGRDVIGGAVKFATPTIANGKVYVGSDGQVGVFGLGSWASNPTVQPASGNYTNSVQVSVTDPTPGAKIYYTTDGSLPTLNSTLYTGPVTLTTSGAFKARAFIANGSPSGVIETDYLINAVIGTGTGLNGAYFNNSQNPSGTPTATELDPTINFNWNGAAPITGVAGTNWAGEWTGYIQAETTGNYTLTTNSDDGVQVYIDGVKIIDDYTYHAPTLDSFTLPFVAGHKYAIDIKYFQGSGGSTLQLYWAAPALPYQIVPTTQLYPN